MVLKVLICGGGSGSHVTAGLLGSKKDFEVRVLTRKPEKWNKEILIHARKVEETKKFDVIGKISKVSSDAKEVASDADVIICGGPSHANPVYLNKIAPYVKKGAFVGALYGQGGFDWAAKAAFGEKYKDVTIFALQHIPWICRQLVYGKEAEIIGPKKYLLTTSIPLSKSDEVAKLVEKLFDLPVKKIPNFLCMTLTPSNQIIHPARYYGIFKDWDGKKTYDPTKIPLLYKDMDEFSAKELQELTNELLAIKNELVKKVPKLDLSSVKDMGQRIIEQYGEDVKDRTNLQTIFSSNNGYAGCKTPVKQVEGGVIPAVESRLFIEDIPFGLIILRDLADLLGIKVPKTDFFIRWHQQFMEKEYLTKDGKLNPKFIGETGCPSRYNPNITLEKLVEDYITK